MDGAAPRGKYLSNTPTEKHQTDAFAPKKCPDLSFQTVRPHQGGRTVHLVEIPNRFGNLKEGSGIIQLLLN